jgi:hypothetical protein
MAGGFVIGGSIFLVLTVFDTITRLQSVEMRDEITTVLTSSTGAGLGLSVSDALSLMRVGLMVAGACAAAAAVLGVYVFQRNRAARLALSVLAVPILLTAPLTGGLVGALVAVATLMLWSGPARDWFAGRPVRQLTPPERDSGSGSGSGPWETTMPSAGDRNHGHGAGPAATPDDVPSASSLSTAGSSTAPGTTSGFGVPPTGRLDAPPASWPPAYAAVGRRSTPPVTVKVACILTWVFSGVVALLYLGAMVALVVAQDRIVDYVVGVPEWQRANLDPDMVLPVLWVGCLMFLGWSLGACLLAWFTWRRHNWARWLLVVSATVTLVAALFAFPVGMLHQLAAALTIGGLLGTAARAWFAGTTWPPPGPGQPGGWPPPQQGLPQSQHPTGPPPQDGPPPGGKPPVW